MEDQLSRTRRLVGEENIKRFARSRVAVFGVGGVGGYVVEALARSGIGTLDLIDNDKVCLSNLNRQIIALHSTLGMYKTDAAKQRVLDINPDAVVNVWHTFYLPETADQFDFSKYDYVVDAIDTVTGKIELILQAKKAGVPVISSMGAGNKLDASAFRVADISQTRVCPLAKVMRRELKKRGIDHLKVVYSEETPLTPFPDTALSEKAGADGQPENRATAGSQPESRTSAGGVETGPVQLAAAPRRRQTPGSMAFVPSVAGLIIAGEIIRDLMEQPARQSENI